MAREPFPPRRLVRRRSLGGLPPLLRPPSALFAKQNGPTGTSAGARMRASLLPEIAEKHFGFEFWLTVGLLPLPRRDDNRPRRSRHLKLSIESTYREPIIF